MAALIDPDNCRASLDMTAYFSRIQLRMTPTEASLSLAINMEA
jgi:hypothetical protein